LTLPIIKKTKNRQKYNIAYHLEHIVKRKEEMSTKFFILILSILFINSIKSDLISDQIYINITSAIPCVRRLNATHQVGCGNLDESNYYGVVYLVENSTDLENIKLINSNEFSKKLIIVTMSSMFKPVVDYYQNIDLKNSKIFSGIVLLSYDNDHHSQSYSDDSSNPNERFSFYNDKTKYNKIDWNLNGSNYMFENFKIPFYLITNSTEGGHIVNCYDTFNRETLLSKTPSESNDRLCGMKLGLQMSASVSSRVCIRRNTIYHTLDSLETSSYCDPLGGSSYYSFLTSKLPINNSISLLTTQLDSFTLFEYYTPGASKPITSIIALLSIADLLSNHRHDFVNELLFGLFSNEAFDYAGSSRFVYDLKEKQFPSLKNKTVFMSKCCFFFFEKYFFVDF
jgi:hypothetical protein